MSDLLIPNVDPGTIAQLGRQASQHGHSLEEEVKAILAGAAESTAPAGWAGVDAIRQRLAASGRTFSDSAELLREDRER